MTTEQKIERARAHLKCYKVMRDMIIERLEISLYSGGLCICAAFTTCKLKELHSLYKQRPLLFRFGIKIDRQRNYWYSRDEKGLKKRLKLVNNAITIEEEFLARHTIVRSA